MLRNPNLHPCFRISYTKLQTALLIHSHITNTRNIKERSFIPVGQQAFCSAATGSPKIVHDLSWQISFLPNSIQLPTNYFRLHQCNNSQYVISSLRQHWPCYYNTSGHPAACFRWTTRFGIDGDHIDMVPFSETRYPTPDKIYPFCTWRTSCFVARITLCL